MLKRQFKKQPLVKMSFEEALKKIMKQAAEEKYARISKYSLIGDSDEFILYASQNGFNLIEEDDRIMIFGQN